MAGLQIWNEPNDSDFWVTDDQAGDYARLVKAAYPAINAARRDVPVVAGALSGADGPFTKALYANGLRGSFDAFSLHPYSNNRAPTVTATGEARLWSFASGIPWIHRIMRRHGDRKPLWLTEFGWPTCQDWDEKCVTPDTQASHTCKAWKLIRRWDYVRGATQYHLSDTGNDPMSVEENYGVLDGEFQPKPAYHALKGALTAARRAARR